MKNLFKYLLLLILVVSTSCSNEPVEFTLITEEENPGVDDGNPPDGGPNENPDEVIYATAKLDGQDFTANQFEVESIAESKIKLSFFSELEQQIFLILPNPPDQGSFTISQNDQDMVLYSGAFINSVGNISESTFYSMSETGEIIIHSYNEESGDISGSFAFDVATPNNNVIIITEGDFEINSQE